LELLKTDVFTPLLQPLIVQIFFPLPPFTSILVSEVISFLHFYFCRWPKPLSGTARTT